MQPAPTQERERRDSACEEGAACAGADGEDDRQSLCQMSDSACSLNGEGEAAGSAAPEAWLVQEYCSLGTLQVSPASCPAMQTPLLCQRSAPCTASGPAKHPVRRQSNRGPSWAWPAGLRRASRAGQSSRSDRARVAVCSWRSRRGASRSPAGGP